MSLVRGPWDKEVIPADVADQGRAVTEARREFYRRLEEKPYRLVTLWMELRTAVPEIRCDYLRRELRNMLRPDGRRAIEIAWGDGSADELDWAELDDGQYSRLEHEWSADSDEPPPAHIAVRHVGYIDARWTEFGIPEHLRDHLQQHGSVSPHSWR